MGQVGATVDEVGEKVTKVQYVLHFRGVGEAKLEQNSTMFEYFSLFLCVGGFNLGIKGPNGDTHLGGDDFDQRIIDFLADEFKHTDGIDLRNDAMAMQRLKDAAEKAKIELSSSQKTTINLPFITATQDGPKHINIDLSRSKFEQLVDDLVKRSIKPCEQALKDAGLNKSDIDQVILVGGSTDKSESAESS